MKKIIPLFLVLGGMACTPVKRTLAESKAEDISLQGKITSACPIEGDCKVQLIPNVSLSIKEVEKGNRAEMYYELIPSEGHDVVIYTYEKAKDSVLMDGFYREEIIFEVPREKQILILENRNLQDVKMIFGRFCYCKGETGYYKVKRGKARIKYNKRRIKADLDIKVLEVPQLIKNAAFSM